MQQHLNFFSPYVKTDKPSPIKSVATIFLLIFLLTIGSYLVLQVQSLVLKKGISDKEDILAHYDAIQLQHLAETKQRIADLTAFREQMGSTEQAVQEIDKVNLELVQKAFANVPPGVVFKDISLSRKEIRILGTSISRPAVAEFEYNLRNSGISNDIKVTNIIFQEQSKTFSFNIQGNLSEGAM